MSLGRLWGVNGVACPRFLGEGRDSPEPCPQESRDKKVGTAPKSRDTVVSRDKEVAAPVEAGPTCRECGGPLVLPKRGASNPDSSDA
jgi:hypothetical protein